MGIIENSYCDPVNGGFSGRDGLAEMLISMFPYIPSDQRENWLTLMIKYTNDTIQLDDKAIAIAKLLDYIESEDDKRQLIKEAILALKRNYREIPNENVYAITLLKKKAPLNMMDEILQLEI